MSHQQVVRVLIADDEPLARELLRSMLATHQDVELVAECGNGREARGAILKHLPDLVFLDIQMPELDGFGVLTALDETKRPLIIFVTAYDHHAVKAFDVHALDYILKPFDERRLDKALARARARLQQPSRHDLDAQVLAVLARLRSPTYLERLAVPLDDRIVLQAVKSIDWFEADGKFVRLHEGGAVQTVRASIGQLETQLDPGKFLRISRSAIVNISRIRELQPWFNGTYIIVLVNGQKIHTTRGYREQVRRLIEGR